MQGNKKTIVLNMAVVIVMLSFMLSLFFAKVDNSLFVSRKADSLIDFGSEWIDSNGSFVSLTKLAKHIVTDNQGDKVIILHKELLKNSFQDSYLNFKTKNLRLMVYIDDEKVYEFMPVMKYRLADGTGSVFHTVLISKEDSAKTIYLKIYPDYSDNSGYIKHMYMGGTSDYFGMIIDRKFLGFFVSSISVILGLFLLVISLLTRKKKEQSRKQADLGAFAMLVGSWLAFDTNIIQLFFGHSILLHELNYLIFIFAPYFLISYVNRALERKTKLAINISAGFTLISVVYMIISRTIGFLDFHQNIWLMDLGFLLCVILIVYMIFDNHKNYHHVHSKTTRVMLTVSLFLSCVFIDILSYTLFKGKNDNGFFMRIGLTASIIMFAMESLSSLLSDLKLASQMEMVKKMAYEDKLTGIGSRTAFDEREKKIEREIKSGELDRVLICQLDLNNLKKVNDSYGHAFGDKYIAKSAEIIKEAFGDNGYVFRVGGDEFSVFLIGDDLEKVYEDGINIISSRQNEFDKVNDIDIPLCLSYGMVIYDGKNYDSIEKAEMAADKKMYIFKNEKKRIANI